MCPIVHSPALAPKIKSIHYPSSFCSFLACITINRRCLRAFLCRAGCFEMGCARLHGELSLAQRNLVTLPKNGEINCKKWTTIFLRQNSGVSWKVRKRSGFMRRVGSGWRLSSFSQ